MGTISGGVSMKGERFKNLLAVWGCCIISCAALAGCSEQPVQTLQYVTIENHVVPADCYRAERDENRLAVDQYSGQVV